MKSDSQGQEKPTILGLFVFCMVCGSMIYLAIFAAERLYLIDEYGWTRFTTEGLRFTELHLKGTLPSSVSNGDKLHLGFGFFVMGISLWIPGCLAGMYLASKCIGHRRLFHSDSPDQLAKEKADRQPGNE
jgi:hypothetical protein